MISTYTATPFLLRRQKKGRKEKCAGAEFRASPEGVRHTNVPNKRRPLGVDPNAKNLLHVILAKARIDLSSVSTLLWMMPWLWEQFRVLSMNKIFGLMGKIKRWKTLSELTRTQEQTCPKKQKRENPGPRRQINCEKTGGFAQIFSFWPLIFNFTSLSLALT